MVIHKTTRYLYFIGLAEGYLSLIYIYIFIICKSQNKKNKMYEKLQFWIINSIK